MFNILGRPRAARLAYERAFAANPVGCAAALRTGPALEAPRCRPRKAPLAAAKGTRSSCGHAMTSRWSSALSLTRRAGPGTRSGLMSTRKFQPWEGGEGTALPPARARTHLSAWADGRCARGTPQRPSGTFATRSAPRKTSGRRTTSSQTRATSTTGWGVLYLRLATEALRVPIGTRQRAPGGDFQAMSVRAYSELTYFSAGALRRLGQKGSPPSSFAELLAHARLLRRTPASVDYFATSLPTMLLFEDDLGTRQTTTAMFLEAQA